MAVAELLIVNPGRAEEEEYPALQFFSAHRGRVVRPDDWQPCIVCGEITLARRRLLARRYVGNPMHIACTRVWRRGPPPRAEKLNRHDLRRRAQGAYCYTDTITPSNLAGIAPPPTLWEPGWPEVRVGARVMLSEFEASCDCPEGRCEGFVTENDDGQLRVLLDNGETADWNYLQVLVVETYPGRKKRSVGEEWALMCRRVQGVVRAFVAQQPDHTAAVWPHRDLGGRKTELLRAVAAGGWSPSWDERHDDGADVASIMLGLSHWLRRQRRLR